jgi:gamma-glutamyltranspeptidase/glutathione hydrolase
MQSRAVELAMSTVLVSLPMLAHEPVRARQAMVVAQESLAADVGVAILKSGGNAVDAAVAMGFALAVTYPQAGNIGGGGFMLIRFADGKSTFIDFRERAPGKATRTMYQDASGNVTKASVEGWTSAGVPGTVRGLEYAHGKFGTRKWADLVAPATGLARDGFAVSYALSESLRTNTKLPTWPESKRIFLKNGERYAPGEILKQPELAAVLDRIAKNGAREFYEGETAKKLAAAMEQNKGTITLEDLRTYQAVERKPLEGSYHGFGIVTAPPPSSGGVGLLQMLGILDGSGYEKTGFGSAATIHYVAEVMRRFYADRSEYLGDPDVTPLRISELLDPVYIKQRRATIRSDRATPSVDVRPGLPPKEGGTQTTHFNVVDTAGNAVAVTYTLNDRYGNGITIPGLGFLLNDEMDDFAAKPGSPNGFGLIQGELNAIAPGKRPLSSMTPTILTKGGQFYMALGGPGGSRIITSVLQVLLNVVDFHMNVQEAVDAPRFHHQWQPDVLSLEHGISPDTDALLRSKGHTVDHLPGWVPAQVNAIVKDQGWLQGASDDRAAGKAAGY